jgi:hypothetical protein
LLGCARQTVQSFRGVPWSKFGKTVEIDALIVYLFGKNKKFNTFVRNFDA